MFETDPIWLINFFLFTTLGFSSFFLFLTSPKKINFSLIKKQNLEENKENYTEVPEVQKIIDKDIFNAQPSIPEEESIEKFEPFNLINVLPIPSIPNDIPIKKIDNKERNFLPPLQLNLHGTIISSNPKQNRAFIENAKNKEEKSYYLGEVIEDAQIIFIGKNKVIFIRSNGQQETLYTNKNSENEEELASKIPWNKIIKKENNEIIIDATLLSKRVKTLGNFLDELDLITFFKDGVPKGCQIGFDEKNSLPYELDLKNLDVILSVNDFSTAYGDSRIEIYKKLITDDYLEPKKIKIKILRNSKEIEMEYKIFKSSEEDFKKSIGILALNNSVLEPKRRSINKEKIIKEQIDGHDSIDNLSKKFESKKKR